MSLIAKELAELGLQKGADGFIYWRHDATQHPRNWSYARKFYDTTTVVFLDFFMGVEWPNDSMLSSRQFSPIL